MAAAAAAGLDIKRVDPGYYTVAERDVDAVTLDPFYASALNVIKVGQKFYLSATLRAIFEAYDTAQGNTSLMDCLDGEPQGKDEFVATAMRYQNDPASPNIVDPYTMIPFIEVDFEKLYDVLHYGDRPIRAAARAAEGKMAGMAGGSRRKRQSRKAKRRKAKGRKTKRRKTRGKQSRRR